MWGLSDWCTAFLSSLNSIRIPAHIATRTGNSTEASRVDTRPACWAHRRMRWSPGRREREMCSMLCEPPRIYTSRGEKFFLRGAALFSVRACVGA